MTKTLIIFLIALVAITRHASHVSCKRRPFTLELNKPMQDASLLVNDLNRTSAHLQPARPGQPLTIKPQLRDLSVAAQTLVASRSRDVVAAEVQQEARNKTSHNHNQYLQNQQQQQHQAKANLTTMSNQPLVGSGSPTSLASVRSKWRQMEQTVAKSMLEASLELKHTLDEIYSTMDQLDKQISQSCKQSLSGLVEGLRDQELWASQMMDSSAATRGLPSGLLEGTLTDLGHYDECLAIGKRSTDPTSGQYCSLLIKPALVGRPRLHTVCRRMPSLSPMVISNGGHLGPSNSSLKLLSQQSHQFYYAGLRLGICVPSSCNQPDVERILQAYLIRFELIGQVKHCQRATDADQAAGGSKQNATITKTIGIKSSLLGQSISQHFDLLQQYILLAYSVVFVLVLVGTWLDDSYSRPPSAKSTGDDSAASHVTHGLADKMEHNGWRARYRDQDDGSGSPRGERTILNGGLQQVKLADDSSQLGPQKNPLVSFTSGVSSPIGSDGSGQVRQPSDNLISTMATQCNNNKVHFEETQLTARAGGPKCRKSVKGCNVAESLPIYDEIHLPGFSLASAKPSLIREFFVCFSLKGNLRSIGKTKTPLGGHMQDVNNNRGVQLEGGMSDIKVIHGLRTLSMIWIIFGHTIGLVSPEMMNNLFALANLSCSSRFLQAVLNTTLAVDTFFMISGLVTVVSFVRKCTSAMQVLVRPSGRELQDIGRLGRTLQDAKCSQGYLGNDYHLGYEEEDEEEEERHDGRETRTDGSYSLDQTHGPKAGTSLELGLDGLEVEVTSVDSSSSVITSLSSSASSNRCIGLTSKSSSQKNFIINKSVSAGGRCVQSHELASGWPTDFKPFSWLIMRYLRLTPAYGAIIGLAILMPALGSGPFWPETVGQLGPACRANWWTNLLYVNNFIETNNLCLIHSWYLSNDWQFFLVALVLFGLAYKSRKLALLVLVGLFVGSSANTFIVTVENDYPPTIVTTSPAVAERWEFIYSLYYKPWPHLPSYLVGLCLGCIILRLQQSGSTTTNGQQQQPAASKSTWLNPSASARFICWLMAISISLAVLNSIYPWNMGIQVDPILTGLHSATFRTLWATCCAWLVFALVTRPRNPLALILSWHGFQITSRLTYCAYLVHPLVIIYHFGVLRERIDSSIYGQLHRFMGTLMMSYLLAFLVSLCFESPFIRMQKFIARLLTSRDFAIKTTKQETMRRRAKPQSQSNQKRKPDSKRTGNARATKTQGKGLNQTLLGPTRETLDGRNANLSSSSSLLKGSFESEHSMPPLKLTRNQVTGQFIVRPMDFASDDSRFIDGYSFASQRLDPRADQRAGQVPSGCGFHDPTAGGCNQRLGSNNGPVDEEFQRKLAQAIGRGFKIRSKIVNGNNKQPLSGIQSRRIGQVKCLPELAPGETGLAPMFALDGPTQRRIKPTQQRSHKPVVTRRTEPFSTFVSLPPNGSTNPGPRGSEQY